MIKYFVRAQTVLTLCCSYRVSCLVRVLSDSLVIVDVVT